MPVCSRSCICIIAAEFITRLVKSRGYVHELEFWRGRSMTTATIVPEANVNAPIAAIAYAAPTRSVMMPAKSAPIA